MYFLMGKLECNMKGKELAYFGFIMDPIHRICRDPEEGGGGVLGVWLGTLAKVGSV